MFNKRDQQESEAIAGDSRKPDPKPSAPRPAPRQGGGTAMIGPSIQVDGKLKGDEDLVIEGKVKGTVELKNNSVTIGNQGDVQADIYAHSIFVDGRMDGKVRQQEVAQCTSCGRAMSRRHVRCMYCGEENLTIGAFDSVL